MSHIDYCNTLFYNIPENLLHKLAKVLYAAMRSVFGLSGSALHNYAYAIPYMKSFHFLPVKFRVEFKIALLTPKCQHGYARTYLKNQTLILFQQDIACVLMMIIGCFKR